MNTIILINERSIKDALSNGYITSKEAKHMLKVYLNQSHFSALSHQETKPREMV